MNLDMPPSLHAHLKAWILNMNPTGSESDAEDLKQYLTDFVDENTLSRPVIEKRLHDALSNFTVTFNRTRNRIEVYDTQLVTLMVDDPNRGSYLDLSTCKFDSAEELSNAARYAETLELAVWDDGEVEGLVTQWFALER